MFSRVRDGLVYPRELLKYRKDKLIYVFLYILFFAALLSTTSVVTMFTFDGLSNAEKEGIQNGFQTMAVSCQIDDKVLECDEPTNMMVYENIYSTFYLNSFEEIDSDLYQSVVFATVVHSDSVSFLFSGITVASLSLSELPTEFHNLNFNLQEEDPTLFYDTLFAGVDKVLSETIVYWGIFSVVVSTVTAVIMYGCFISFSAYFMKKRFAVIPFKQAFVLTTYSSTGLFIILVFNSIIGLNIFLIIVLLVFAFRQNSILNNEINRRLQNKA